MGRQAGTGGAGLVGRAVRLRGGGCTGGATTQETQQAMAAMALPAMEDKVVRNFKERIRQVYGR